MPAVVETPFVAGATGAVVDEATLAEEDCVIDWDMAGSFALLLPSPSSVVAAAPPSFGVTVMTESGFGVVESKKAREERWERCEG